MTARAAAVLVAGVLLAQSPQQLSPSVHAFVKVEAPILVLTHARVIDGTGAAPLEDQTLVIRDGSIAAIGQTGTQAHPEGSTVLDLTGKTVIPGLVMMHEHTYYPTGPGVYGQLGESFVRLYLAGGVTTMRTAGNANGVMDIELKRQIDAGRQPGPAIDATAPYLNGEQGMLQMHVLKDADDARRQVDYWADMGATSFKAYMNISRDELRASIEEAHRRGLKITGHLCSVTYAEAADLGIDNLEHGFLASTDFVADKKPDACPGQTAGQRSIASLDPQSERVHALIDKLVDKHVALTSTLTVFETFTPGRPKPPGLEVLLPELRESFETAFQRSQQNTQSVYAALFPMGMALERAFVKAGGLLIAGTDPTGIGGVIPGFSDQRQIELLVEEGFTPVEAIRIATLNGARYLGRDTRIGSITVGKQADLVVVNGDPSKTITDVRKVEIVFKQGVGFDSPKLIASVTGKVGLW
jgi:imidazolonepropionase-like amidohydrolase